MAAAKSTPPRVRCKPVDPIRRCLGCNGPMPEDAHPNQRFCSGDCPLSPLPSPELPPRLGRPLTPPDGRPWYVAPPQPPKPTAPGSRRPPRPAEVKAIVEPPPTPVETPPEVPADDEPDVPSVFFSAPPHVAKLVGRSRKRAVAVTCEHCGETFFPKANGSRSKWCSPRCGALAWKKANRPERPAAVTCGMLGAAQEMLVCADLLLRGVQSFRAISPACPCDLIASVGGRLLRIEVRTGYRGAQGGLTVSATHRRSGGTDSYDVLAVVLPDRSIVYRPDPFTEA